ncbi:MAG: SDR family oxidoreductase, partial [Bacteroidota bacterium]
AGAKVIVIGRSLAKAERLTEELAQIGHEMDFFAADVLEVEQLSKVGEEIAKKYPHLDGLVNCAGGNLAEGVVENSSDIFSINLEGVARTFELNFFGSLQPIQIFGPLLQKSSRASIVNISSVSAKKPLTKVLGYTVGKAAIDAYSNWLSLELAKRFGEKIRINTLTPGFFLSEQNKKLLSNEDGSWTDRAKSILQQTPFNRFGKADELVGALIWLLSDESSFVTGSDIKVDGGFLTNSGV